MYMNSTQMSPMRAICYHLSLSTFSLNLSSLLTILIQFNPTLTHHQSGPIYITSNQVSSDQGLDALHYSSKGAVSWLWSPSPAGFISYWWNIYKRNTLLPRETLSFVIQTAYIINEPHFWDKVLYLPLCAYAWPQVYDP